MNWNTRATECGTDKSDGNHTVDHETYIDVYDGHWSSVRQQIKTVVELGVRDGGSLKLWLDYFPRAEIWGLDVKNPAMDNPRIHLVTGRQEEKSVCDLLCPDKTLDIVIDDCGHQNSWRISSYEFLWPRVSQGGFYVMEDMSCGYGEWPKGQPNPREPMDAFLNGIIHEMDNRRGDVKWLHIHSMLTLMRKKGELPL